mmetsp:Transcript_87374/g.187367  ORF Transcript_87374/g.187367 Transcript_87374/m.187367 type:complete len:430 (+) Transcript_87374:110-1399(+)
MDGSLQEPSRTFETKDGSLQEPSRKFEKSASTVEREVQSEVDQVFRDARHIFYEGPSAQMVAMWHAHAQRPHFFSKLHIAQDGGLNEVGSLFYADRFVWAFVNVLCILVNIWFVVQPNIDTLSDPTKVWLIPQRPERFLLSTRALRAVSSSEKEIDPDLLVAAIELGLFAVRILTIAFSLGRILWYVNEDKSPVLWDAVADFFFESLPDLSSFSAMSFLYYISPSVFFPQVGHKLTAVRRRNCRLYGMPLHFFMLTRAWYGLIGFDSFLVKFQHAAVSYSSGGSDLNTFINCAAFLNQMLGVVHVSTYVRWRLLVYIFGGEDGYISSLERVRSQTWHALLAQKVWISSRSLKMPRTWFWAVMLSYSDYDFQKLTLNENSRASPQRLAISEETAAGTGDQRLRNAGTAPSALLGGSRVTPLEVTTVMTLP